MICSLASGRLSTSPTSTPAESHARASGDSRCRTRSSGSASPRSPWLSPGRPPTHGASSGYRRLVSRSARVPKPTWPAGVRHSCTASRSWGAHHSCPPRSGRGDPHRSPNRTVHGRTRFGFLPGSCQQCRDRIRVVSPEYTVVDVARHGSRADGLVAADAAVRAGASRDVMRWLVGRMTTYPGIDIASWSAKQADPHSESPVETVGRLAFLLCGRQAPQSNVWISKGANRFRVDHLVPGTGVVLEADGAVKYNMRDDAATVVHQQNRREELLRAWGFEVVGTPMPRP